MDLSRELVVPASPTVVASYVDDLESYPPWMSLITDVERLDDAAAPDAAAPEADVGPAWAVVLQAQVGPFTRSKRLRMVRTELEPDRRVVFERREIDGRDHAMWRLDAVIEPHADGALLRMGLHYGGRLWGGPVLERVLDAKVAEASERLVELVA